MDFILLDFLYVIFQRNILEFTQGYFSILPIYECDHIHRYDEEYDYTGL